MLGDPSAGLGGEGIDVQLAVARPAAPQDVEHLILPVGRVVVAEYSPTTWSWLLERVAEEVAKPRIGAKGVNIAIAVRVGGKRGILLLAELIGHLTEKNKKFHN